MSGRVASFFLAALDWRGARATAWTSIRLAWRRDRTAELLELAELLHQAGAGRCLAAVELAELLHQVVEHQVAAYGTRACFPPDLAARDAGHSGPTSQGDAAGRAVRTDVPGAAAGRSRPGR